MVGMRDRVGRETLTGEDARVSVNPSQRVAVSLWPAAPNMTGCTGTSNYKTMMSQNYNTNFITLYGRMDYFATNPSHILIISDPPSLIFERFFENGKLDLVFELALTLIILLHDAVLSFET